MASVAVDSGHEDMIHDVQLDFYGKRLATCSSDRVIKIFEVLPNGAHKLVSDLRGHDGPVWQIAWAHPKFGSILASCGYDKRVLIWKEVQPGQWAVINEISQHKASANSVSWGPVEIGLCLASCSSDGLVCVTSLRSDDTWEAPLVFDSQQVGCNAVSWAPFSSGSGARRFATAGCDKSVRIWTYNEPSHSFLEERRLTAHSDWVRDVAWCPAVAFPHLEVLATGGQDKRVFIWRHELASNSWEATELPEFAACVWKLSWSVTGNLLAVTTADNRVSLWKESVDGSFKEVEVPELEAMKTAE